MKSSLPQILATTARPTLTLPTWPTRCERCWRSRRISSKIAGCIPTPEKERLTLPHVGGSVPFEMPDAYALTPVPALGGHHARLRKLSRTKILRSRKGSGLSTRSMASGSMSGTPIGCIRAGARTDYGVAGRIGLPITRAPVLHSRKDPPHHRKRPAPCLGSLGKSTRPAAALTGDRSGTDPKSAAKQYAGALTPEGSKPDLKDVGSGRRSRLREPLRSVPGTSHAFRMGRGHAPVSMAHLVLFRTGHVPCPPSGE